MLQLYLPIAGVHVSLIKLAFIGVITGVLGGAFGVGGTFFSIPVMTSFLGVPLSVAISSSASQMVASSSVINRIYMKNNMVDLKLAGLTFIGSITGVIIGSKVFSYVNSINQTNTLMGFIYIFFLGSIAIFMFQESLSAIAARRKQIEYIRSDLIVRICNAFPYKIYCARSGISISIFLPPLLGFLGGLVVSLAGIGSGFIVIPALIYVFRLPTSMALGTANFIGFGTAALSAFLQAFFSKTVDIVLATVLIISSVVGVRMGSKVLKYIPPEEMRLILSIIMFILIFKFLLQIFLMPSQLYTFSFIR